MKLTDNQQIILNELAKNNGSIDDYKVVLTSVLSTSVSGVSRVVNNLKKEYMVDIIDGYTLTLTKVGNAYVTVEVTKEDKQSIEINKLEKDIYFNINAARTRIPKGYQVEKFESGYEIVNRDGKIILNETEIPQEDLRSISLNDKYTVALVQNAFSFLEEANEKYAELQALQSVEEVKEVETTEKSTTVVTPKEEQKLLSEESIQTQILKVVNLATELFIGIKVDTNNQIHLWDYKEQKIVDDYVLSILYMTSKEYDKQQEDKLIELKKIIQRLNPILYNKKHNC